MAFLPLPHTILIIIFNYLAFSSAKKICCEEVGCFTNDPPFKHLYLPECPSKMGIKYTMYNRGGHQGALTRNAVPSHFNPAARTVFIIHGWMNSGTTGWVLDMKDALLEKYDHNVVVVDWEKGAGHLFYPYSATNVRTVGAETADMMDTLVNKGSSTYNNMWCVGHSLGAHSCGQTGLKTEGTIARITGLDPAGPWFDDYDIKTGLCPEAAKFVDVMHTDGWGLAAFYGTLRPLGHADFYPNEGYYQPGCWTYSTKSAAKQLVHLRNDVQNTKPVKPYGSVSCSHSRAPQLFIESVKNTGCFRTRLICTDEGNLPASCMDCAGQDGACTKMGYEADENLHGKFHLETTSGRPYCKW